MAPKQNLGQRVPSPRAKDPGRRHCTDVRVMRDLVHRSTLDPAVDAAKLQLVLEAQDRLLCQSAKANYEAAFVALQAELPTIAENGSILDRHGRVQSTYAKWEDINEVIKPILARHGFALRFRIDQRENRVAVMAVLTHVDGHSDYASIQLPSDLSNGKTSVQAIGSSTSYGQRYATRSILNISSRSPEDRDTDGTVEQLSERITNEQVRQLSDELVSLEANPRKFLDWLGVEELKDLPSARLDDAWAGIRIKRGYGGNSADRSV